MVTDAQFRRLMKRIHSGDPLAVAAAKADMDEKTARKYRRAAKLPSQASSSQRGRLSRPPTCQDGASQAYFRQRSENDQPTPECLRGAL